MNPVLDPAMSPEALAIQQEECNREQDTAAALELIDHGENAGCPFAHYGRPNKGPRSQPNVHSRQQEEPGPPAQVSLSGSVACGASDGDRQA